MQRKQNTVTRDKHDTELIARGRHDPCVVPRGNPLNSKCHDFFSFKLNCVVIE